MENNDIENLNRELRQPFITNEDKEYTKEITVETVSKGIEKFTIEVPAKPTEKYQQEMWNSINEFEKESWEAKRKGFDTGFKSFNKAFDGGLKSGFIVIAGDSNIGKSAMISQLAINISTLNSNAYVMDFSLDDPKPDKLSRIIACRNKIPINAVKSPENYSQYPYMLLKRLEGINDLRRNTDRYVAYDAKFGTDIEKIEKKILETKDEFDSNKIDKQIIVFIDNFHDLTIASHPNWEDKKKFDFLAQKISDMSINLDIPIICSAEFRKLNGTGRPSSDEIREAVKIKYEAKAIILCHSDVHAKGENAQIFFNRKEMPDMKCPVFETHFAKNKMGSFKGRAFFKSFPELAYMEECDEQLNKYYSSIILGN